MKGLYRAALMHQVYIVTLRKNAFIETDFPYDHQMQDDILQHRSVLSWLFQLHDLSPFLGAKIYSSEHYDHQLSLIDAAAEAWLSMMKGWCTSVCVYVSLIDAAAEAWLSMMKGWCTSLCVCMWVDV